jgi:hypothetical protein
MPTISMFYGILIRMFFYDMDKHHVPHIHAEYQDAVAVGFGMVQTRVTLSLRLSP